jgi:hypothetical protein
VRYNRTKHLVPNALKTLNLLSKKQKVDSFIVHLGGACDTLLTSLKRLGLFDSYIGKYLGLGLGLTRFNFSDELYKQTITDVHGLGPFIQIVEKWK